MNQSNGNYSEGFVSVVFFVFLLVVLIALLVFLKQGMPVTLFLILTVVTLLLWLNFSRLTVEVDRDTLSFTYGIGLIQSRYPLALFTRGFVEQPSFSFGWLYHPFTTSTLVLHTRDGGEVHVPSRNPKYLSQLILVKARD